MSDEIRMDWTRFETSLQRRLATSSRDHLLVLSEQARGIMRTVVELTPPGHDGVPGTGRKARQMGMAAVARDIKRIYGTPGDMFAEIKQRNEQMADAFYGQVKARDIAAASATALRAIGKPLYPFDGGSLHKRFKGKQGRVKSRAQIFYVEDEKELKNYIKERQKHVQFLQAGWKSTAAKLGIQLPGSITSHNSPGAIAIEVSAQRLRIIATNAVKYASNADVERRIQWAINRQASKMERQWETYAQRFNQRSGL